MAKINFFFLIILSFNLQVVAQIKEFVVWEIIRPDKINTDKEIEILFFVRIKTNYYISFLDTKLSERLYSSIWFRETGDFQIIKNPETIYEMEYSNKYSNNVEYILEDKGGLVQSIKILKDNPIISGQINYVLCNKESTQKINQVYKFQFQLITSKQ